MDIRTATSQFKRWLEDYTPLVASDWQYKSRQMASAPFPFLRATFYRWVQLWSEVCPDLAKAPKVLAVGDLHIENFGTWRDSYGRLIWGINDFDEVYDLAYTIDLVRLATSMLLAVKGEHLETGFKSACEILLDGYRRGLKAGGKPFVLEDEHPTLRALALGRLRDPVRFWGTMNALRQKAVLPPDAVVVAGQAFDLASIENPRVVRRRAGLGSLGKPRIVVLGQWHGGMVAIEAKSLTPSACLWAQGGHGPPLPRYQDILDGAVRCPDPYLRVVPRWIARRLAPDCSRIELDCLSQVRDEAHLIHAMGWETANIHLGSQSRIKHVLEDLQRRKPNWLRLAARQMAQAVKADWKSWRKATRHADATDA